MNLAQMLQSDLDSPEQMIAFVIGFAVMSGAVAVMELIARGVRRLVFRKAREEAGE